MAFDIYSEVTNRIIAQLEKGVIPWRKTWHGSEPINYISRKAYRGINLLLLPYGGEWLTFKQAKDSGGNVKKGEKSSMIVFFKMVEKKGADNNDGEKEMIPFLQYSNVFHISQCENITSKVVPIEANDIEPIQAAETILNGYIKRSGVKLEHVKGSNNACYRPSTDVITMPVIGQFESAEEYYSTAFHEAAHSTGHKSRLDRDTIGAAAFGSGTYSKEELIAEISAASIMNFVGIELPQTFENSVAYIKSWVSKLREDVKAIVTASSKAQKATDLILNITE
jgi:antirestriction protein ArdC